MNRRSGLGRGLAALIPDDGPEDTAAPPAAGVPPAPGRSSGADEGLVLVAVDRIVPNPWQPRSVFDDERQQELVESVRLHGILQPILLRSTSFGYELVAGERRWRAACSAGLVEIPALVVQIDDRESLEQAIVENLHRDDLNPIEEAAAFHRLMDEFEFTQQQVASRVGRSRSAVANALRLLHLDDHVQLLVIEGAITAGHGRALLGVDDQQVQRILARRIVDEGLTVRQIEDLVRDLVADPVVVTPPKPDGVMRDAGILEVERLLSDQLDTKVNVSTRGGRGRIIVTFADRDDLHRIYGLLAR